MVYDINTSSWDIEEGRSVDAWGQPGLQNEFKANQDCHRETLSQNNSLNKNKKQQQQQKTKESSKTSEWNADYHVEMSHRF